MKNNRIPSEAKMEAYRLLPPEQIKLSPRNPRKHFDPEALAELTESIRAKGVLEPLLVRPLYRTKGGAIISSDAFWETVSSAPGLLDSGLYELVAGERRYRAAELAGEVVVPVIIRELSDKDADEIRIVENEQRKDLSPIEKADGYQFLIDQHGYTIEELGAKVSKSPSTIRGLVALCKLPEKARAAVDAGDPLACRHCGKTGRKLRPKGLCYKCSYDPAIRDRYPSTSKFAQNAAKGIAEYVPSDDELDALADVDRVQAQPIDERLEAIVGYFGACCTHQQVLNHLREDRLTCTLEEFQAVKDRLHPPPEDWKGPAGTRKRAV